MDIMIDNRFTNLGVVTRISRIVLAKTITVASAYGAVNLGGLITGAWFLLPVLLAAYLLFTGLVGWDPLSALDERLKRASSLKPTVLDAMPAIH